MFCQALLDVVDAVAPVIVLADPKGPANVGPDFGKAGPFGLTIVVLLLVGTFFLIRSMNGHLRKLPETFDPEHPEPDQNADDGTTGKPEWPGPGEHGEDAAR